MMWLFSFPSSPEGPICAWWFRVCITPGLCHRGWLESKEDTARCVCVSVHFSVEASCLLRPRKDKSSMTASRVSLLLGSTVLMWTVNESTSWLCLDFNPSIIPILEPVAGGTSKERVQCHWFPLVPDFPVSPWQNCVYVSRSFFSIQRKW